MKVGGRAGRGRKLRLWRYHALHYRVVAVSAPAKRTRRDRPPKSEAAQVEVRYRLLVDTEPLVPSEDNTGGRARLHGTAGGVYGYGVAPSLSGATYYCRTGLSLDLEPGSHPPRVAGETGPDCGLGHAHGRGVAGVCGAQRAGPSLSA